MVAVISGNGLGLGNSSLNTLGSQGAVGNAAEGKAGEQIYVNSSNGDLIIRDQDDYLASLGLNLPLTRTYNSEGELSDDLGGNWRLGVNERLINLTGTLYTAGSTVTRVSGDESQVVYVFDSTRQAYVATGQSGAIDEITLDVNTNMVTWRDGATNATETYDLTGRLLTAADPDGNTRTYSYTGDLLTSITDASGQTTNFDYTGNNLTQIRAASQTLAHYTYDSQNRLQQVQLDLSPNDNAITDGKVYATTYTYDGTSSRITSISRSDGTSVGFTYELSNGVYRVKTYTTNGHTTTLTYTSSGASSVSATANSSVLSTTDNVPQTYNLNSGALSGSAGTVGFVQGNNAVQPNSDTISLPFTSAQTAGNLNVVVLGWISPTETLTSVTDSMGNVYTRAGSVTTYDNSSAVIYYAKNIVGAAAGENTLTVTFSGAVDWPDVRTAEYQGVDQTNPLDGMVGSTGVGLTLDSGSLTTTHANDVLVGSSYVQNEVTGAGALFVQEERTDGGEILEDRTVSSVGTYNATAPLDGEGWWIMQMAAFKAASGSGSYYLVPSGATWQSVANALYGVNSAAAGTALQTAMGNPALTAGAHLTGMPATLTVTTTQTVPAYYVVPASATWASIAQAVYGTSDPGAVAALQTATGNPTLTTGLHLTVPSTLTYTAGGSGSGQFQTDLTDALGQTTTYFSDSSGRVTSILSPTVAGSRLRVDYTYDAKGNVTAIAQDPAGSNRITTMAYDANGNLVLTRDALGDTITRTYSATNELLTETRYLTPDPDGAGSAQPGAPVTTRYAYDSEGHLRFSVSAEGRVVEYRYNTPGQLVSKLEYTSAEYSLSGLAPTDTLGETQLSTWTSAQDLKKLQRTDYTYDFRGNLSTSTAYASTDVSGVGVTATSSVTHYSYDQRGLLLQTIDPRGATSTSGEYATTYIHDGLGRVISSTQWIDGGTSATTLTTYDSANNRTVSTFANGLISTSIYDSAGYLTSVVQSNSASQALGTTTYTYDADGRLRVTTDASGVRQFVLYDEAGRKVGDVDGTGALTRYVYDANSEVVETIRYADALSSTQLASLLDAQGNPANVGMGTLLANLPTTVGRANDQIGRIVYDRAGRRLYTIDPNGDVTKYVYDGESRLIAQVQYATPVSIASSVGELLPGDITVTSNAKDRLTRNFYDNDSNLVGTLDAAGYLVEYTYDAADQLTQQTAYAKQTDSSLWVTGTLSQLRPTADPVNDMTSHFFYDGEGRQIGTLDGEGYLSEATYDTAGNVDQQTRYDSVRTYAAGATVDSLRPTGVTAHTTTFQYDGANRLVQKTDYEGTITTNTYDLVGNLTSSTHASGTSDARTIQERYDAQGRLIAQLSAQGSSLITNGMTPTQIEAVWTQYAAHFTYDLVGRKISSTDQNNNTTLYYYDSDGQLRYAVNAMGEVTELRYNALGQQTDSIAYNKRISTASLTGGTVTTTLTDRIVADATKDAHTVLTYRVTGQLASKVTAEGASTTYTYDAFGDIASSVAKIDSTHSLTHDYTYDARGLLLQTVWDPNGALNSSQSQVYDAFGRLTDVTDANGNTTHTAYDRMGRQVTSTDALGGQTVTTYDAFSRVLSIKDALQNTTSYSYNDGTRSVTVTTPEGITATTIHNRNGQTLSVTAGGNTTTYAYDANGALQSTSDNLGSLESRTYDAAGRQLTDTDALGTVTTLSYDAANRVLTSTVDSVAGGLRLTTTYTYDGEGRVIQVDAPNGRTTTTQYDRDGRVMLVSVDPNGTLNLRTQYSYDLEGHVLTVTEGYGSANPRKTQYVYDTLGRRTDEFVDPTSLGGTLNLHTQYKYDANGNVTRKVDASGSSTWYVYDPSDRLHYTVDALGGVTETIYDADNRVTGTRRYATPISTASLGDVVTGVTVQSAPALDRLEQTVYDKDGRSVYSINAMGGVTERQFDSLGHVTREMMYAKPIAAGTYTSPSAVVTALNTAGNTSGTPSVADHVNWTAYDVRGRAIYAVDGSGSVVRNTYDAADNLVSTRAFSTTYGGSAKDLASLQTWDSSHTNAATDRVTNYWYDTTGRPRFTQDAEGYLHETRYDDAGRQTIDVLYAGKASITGSSSLAQVVSAAQALDSSAHSQTQTTTSLYDVAGRLVKVTDALGNFETYEYDAVGNKTKYTNKNNVVWTYEYDANHRLTYEHSPNVAVTTVTETNGVLSSTTNNSQSLTTYIQYDALGNVRFRTEAYGTSQARTTEYQYDALGRQVKTIFPPVGVYSAPTGDVQRVGAAVVRADNTQSLYTEVAYDTLGNEYRNRDVAGNYSYKTYDALGRVTYAVDAQNYLTEYGYDAFGNQTTLTRYSKPLKSTLPTTSASVSNSDVFALRDPDSNADRTVTTTYDRLNRKVQVTQPAAVSFAPTANASGGATFTAAATTFYAYDAFGDVVRESQLVNPLGNAVTDPSVNATANSWAHTYSYYDRLGNKSAQVDALGYLTSYEHDQHGNLTRQVEYATAISPGWTITSHASAVATTPSSAPGNAAGYDRDTRYTYDQLNQKRTQTLAGVEYTQINGATTTTAVGDQTTTYGYDVLGNQTQVTDAAGASTYTYYDVLGRVIAIAEPQRVVDGSSNATLTPLTVMRRDAYGNLVEQIRYANGAASANASTYTAGSASSNDRDTRILIDAAGHTLHTSDSGGVDRYASYNERGDVAKEWQYVTNADGTLEALVTIHQYDKLGRETAVIEPQSLSGTPVIVSKESQYNAFGEIISKGTNGGAQEYFDYDNAGHLWRTNTSDGVNKVYLYDLQGNSTVEIRSKTLDLKASYSDAQTVNGLTSGVLRTETRYDLLGHIVEQRLPTYSSTSGLQAITSTFSIGQVSGPANPSAIYQLVTLDDGAGPYQTYVVNPSATLADGGGYYLNADGTYTQDPNHALVTAVRVTWDAPSDASVEATFQYRVLGSTDPNAWASIPVGVLANNKLGANVNSLLNQTYEYRVSYRRRTDTTAYAEATGTFALTGTTSTTVAISQNPVDPASEIATLATTQANGIVSWTAPTDTSVTAVLRVRVHLTEQWTDITAHRVGANFQADASAAVAIAHDYDYEIDYIRDGNVIARKAGDLSSPGTTNPLVGSGILDDIGSVTGVVTPIATPTGQVTGSVGAGITQSEFYFKGDSNTHQGSWSGTNTLNLSWANIGTSPVKVELDYQTAAYNYWFFNSQDVAWDVGHADPTAVTNKTFTIASGAATGTTLQWGSSVAGGPGGISAINAVRVYTQNSSGAWVLQYTQSNPTPVYGRGLLWTASPEKVTPVTPSFEYAVPGSNNWQLLPVTTSTPNYGVDLNSVIAGTYDYRIRYRLGNRIAAEQIGSMTINNALTVTTTSTTVAPDSAPAAPQTVGTVTAASGNTLGASISSSMTQGISGSKFVRVWSGTNSVSTSWTSLGSVPVMVVLDYVTQSGFHWDPIPQDPGSFQRVDDPAVTRSRSFTFSAGGAGQTLSWTEDPGSTNAGISQISNVRVYTQDASGNYTVLQRQLGVTRTPTLSWSAPASTTAVTFGYRVAGSGSGYTFITPTISGSQVSVNVNGLSGNYEYYIGYRRSGESFDASGATGSFSVSGLAASTSGQTPFTNAPAWLSGVSASGSSVTWTQQPVSGASVTFEYLLNGNWLPLTASTGDNVHYSASFAGLSGQAYSYRIRYTQAGASLPYIQATGTANVSVSQVVNPASVTAGVISNQTFPAHYITGVTATGNGISWSYANPEPANSTIVVHYSWDNNQATITLPGNSGTNLSVVFDQVVGDGSHTIGYTIQYLRPGETDPYASANGIDTLTISHPVIQPTLTINSQADAFPSGMQPISAPTYLGNNYIGWTTAAESGAQVKFRYQSAGGGGWTELTVLPNGTGYKVDVSSIAELGYKYEITYTRAGETNPYAGSTGSLTITRPTTVTSFTTTANPPANPPSVSYTPTTLQSFDRWGNAISITDASNQTTNFRYNQLGALAETQDPTVDVVSTAGGNVGRSRERPVETNYYDLLGRLIGTRDADNNLNQVTLNAAGETLSELHADGGTKSSVYDAFGNQTLVTNELGYRTWNTYDSENHLASTTREVSKTDATQNITERYTYDTAGRRITDTIVNADNKGNDETTRYFYDLLGNLIKLRTPLGRETTYTYDTQGRKTGETDPINGKLTWTYDYFGHVRTHVDLANVSYTYNYADFDGLMSSQTGTNGQNIAYGYDEAGQLTQINDTGVGRTTTYTYDSAGRHAREKTVINGLTYQDTAISYDELGRVKGLTDLRYALTYSYDAQGNRTDIDTTYYDHEQQLQTQDLWYTYDSMNRVLISQGVNTLDSIGVQASQGIQLTYDAAGERTTAYTYGTQIEHEVIRIWNPSRQEFDETNDYLLNPGMFTQVYSYDGIGRLTTTTDQGTTYRLFVPQQGSGSGNESTVETDYITDQRTYDHASRQLTDVNSAVDPNQDDLVTHTRTSVYDHDSHLQSQTTTQHLASNSAEKNESVISYGFDAAGVLRNYTVQAYDTTTVANALLYTSTYSNLFHLGDTYQDAGQNVSSTGPQAPTNGSTAQAYNVDGELISFTDSREPTKDRYFANNASGEALTVVQGNISNVQQAFANALARSDNGTKSQYFFFANGQAIGSFGQLTDVNNKFKANFDVNYTPISSDYPTAVPSEVIAQDGDTLRTIAARVLGDASLWYLIAEANGRTNPDEKIAAGTVLQIPNRVVSLSNDSSSYKPFDVSQAIGDTTPTQPLPPVSQQGGCGVFGQILEIVVAVVVTYFTAGALTGTLGPILAGAIGGAAGSVASQATAIADGDQKGFSWKSVGIGAIGGAVEGGVLGPDMGVTGSWGDTAMTSLGVPASVATYGAVAVNAASISILTQGVAVATGLQHSFSWKAVAEATAAAPVNALVGKYATQATNSTFVGDFFGHAAGALTQQAVGGRIQVGAALVDAFGNTLGDSVVGEINDYKNAQVAAGVQARRMQAVEGGETYNHAAREASGQYVPPAIGISAPELDNNPSLFDPSTLASPDSRSAGAQERFAADDPQAASPGPVAQLPEVIVESRHWNDIDDRNLQHLTTPILSGGDGLVDDHENEIARRTMRMTDMGFDPVRQSQDLDILMDLYSPIGHVKAFAAAPYNLGVDIVAGWKGLFGGAQAVNDTRSLVGWNPYSPATTRALGAVARDVRSFSERHIGDGPTTLLGGGLELVGDLAIGAPMVKGLQASAFGKIGNYGVEIQDIGATGPGASQAGGIGVRVGKFVNIASRDDFLAVSLNPEPNTTYRYDGFKYTTDSEGRALKVEGTLRDSPDNRFPYRDRLIGQSGDPGDVGFHLGADRFGFSGGPLNVVPGNGALNGAQYKALETKLAGYIAEGRQVDASFNAVYNRGNMTTRPDGFMVRYRVDGGDWLTRPFENRPGG